MPKKKKGFNQEAMREAFERAAQKWMDEKYRQFGKWAIRTLLAAGFLAFVKFVVLGVAAQNK